MLRNLFFLTLSLNTVKALRQIQHVENKTDVSGVFKCAKAIGERHFLQTQNVEIISQERIYGFEDFGVVIRTTTEFRYHDFRESPTKYAVIFLEGINYQKDLQMLSTLRRSDPQGRFIISIKNEINPSISRKQYVERIIFYLASIERWNVVILTNEAGNGIIRMYTYTMYSSGNCVRVPKLVDHGRCDDAVTLNNLFPAFVNFHECPINLSTTDFPPFSMVFEKNGEKQIDGIEAEVVKLIVAKLNATSKVFHVGYGAPVRDMVKTRKADLAWACMLQYEYAGTVWSQSYIINKVLIVIPQSRLMPLWMNLILPFQTEVWATVGTLICVHLFIKVLIPPVRREFHLEWMLSGFFGVGIVKLPRRLSHRLYLISWILSGYVVMQCYSASLTGFFASPGHYEQMQTVNELDKSKIVLGGFENMKSQLAETNPRLARDFKVLTDEEYFGNIEKMKARTGGIATYGREDRIENITHGQESHFVVIPEHVNVYPLALMLPNSSPILEGCNQVIHSVCDSGLIRFWYGEFTRQPNSGFKPDDENSNQRTSSAYLPAAFFVLCVGYCFSSIIFAMELSLAKFWKQT